MNLNFNIIKKNSFEETYRKNVWPNICLLCPHQVDIKLLSHFPSIPSSTHSAWPPALISLKWVQCSLASHVCKLCFIHFLIHSIATDGVATPRWLLWWTITFHWGTQYYRNVLATLRESQPLLCVHTVAWPMKPSQISSEAKRQMLWLIGMVRSQFENVFLAHSLGFHADLVDTVQIPVTHHGSSYPLIWRLVCNVTHSDGFPIIVKQDKTKSSHLS